MNKTNFVQTGGFPLNAERLEELEKAYSIFNAYGALAGDLTIISGCVTTGSNVSDGYVYISGELLPFKGAAATTTSNVIIVEQKINRPFENTEIKTVHTLRYATFGTAETSWPWSDFVRPMETKAMFSALQLKANKSIVDNILNRLQIAEDKLATIATGAEVNVQADMNETDVNSDAYVRNQPKVSQPFLHKGTHWVGDVGAHGPDTTFTIPIPDIGTSNYVVVGSLVSEGNVLTDNDVTWITKNTSSTSFQLSLREGAPGAQALEFRYVLIAL
ncbi:hypothetical protein [Flavobacterium sp.]|uniref:hypothetical protein n=1 Tax=Flavobacterium sp. TaxID=239 RepID=UPI00261AFEC9|nr:hypothetical protein [Flavobacterium sp.]